MKLVRPKLKELLMKNSEDPTALILYALTGMYLELPPNEASEIEHILLTLLQFEQMGIDVSGCKELWGQIAYTQVFESNYDSQQMDGKSIRPITFEEKRNSQGFLTESAQSTVAEFVFMNMSNLDKDWMELYSNNPLLASGIISVQKGLTRDLWKLANQNPDGEIDMSPYEDYRALVLTDINRAIDGLKSNVLLKYAIYGSSFIRNLLLASLICMDICDGRSLDENSREVLNSCINDLETCNSFPEGTSLEDILFSFHRELKLPELYFLQCFTLLIMAVLGYGQRTFIVSISKLELKWGMNT